MEPPDDLELTEPERCMWKTVMSGRLCDLGDGDPRELTSPDDWGPERTIRGHVLAELLVRAGAIGPPAIRQVRIQGARVIGAVDLTNGNVAAVMQFGRCRFEDDVLFLLARTRTLQVQTCALASIYAVGASIEGFLEISKSDVWGGIFLNDARISRSMVLSGSRIIGGALGAIIADCLEIGGDARMDKGFYATGVVQILGVRIGGSLTCSGGLFQNPGGRALAADGAVIGVGVFLNKLSGGTNGFFAAGTVQLTGARIAGQLNCCGGRFHSPGGDAFVADGAEIGVGLLLSKPSDDTDGFCATGVVRLLGARITGQLICAGGRFDNPGGDALVADGAEIRGSVRLDAGFHATGQVGLAGARISGDVSCSGGRFDNPEGIALSAEKAEIDDSVLLNKNKLSGGTDGFHATGEVRLLSARIGDQLNCSGGWFENPRGTALSVQEARANSLWLCGPSPGTAGLIDLIEAKVSLLVDDRKALVSPEVFFRLDGFVYERIAPSSPQDVPTRLKWLGQQPGYQPQPFDQLAAVYRRNGQDHEARDVLVAKHRARRNTLRGWWRKFGDVLLDLSLLYGWQAWRPLAAGFAIFLPVFGLVLAAQAAGLVVGPSDTTSSYHPFIHALDVFLPIVDLGIESRWTIDTANGGRFAWLVMAFLWTLKLVGWVVVTLALASVTGIVKRE